jgi:hypothetical protein
MMAESRGRGDEWEWTPTWFFFSQKKNQPTGYFFGRCMGRVVLVFTE